MKNQSLQEGSDTKDSINVSCSIDKQSFLKFNCNNTSGNENQLSLNINNSLSAKSIFNQNSQRSLQEKRGIFDIDNKKQYQEQDYSKGKQKVISFGENLMQRKKNMSLFTTPDIQTAANSRNESMIEQSKLNQDLQKKNNLNQSTMDDFQLSNNNASQISSYPEKQMEKNYYYKVLTKKSQNNLQLKQKRKADFLSKEKSDKEQEIQNKMKSFYKNYQSKSIGSLCELRNLTEKALQRNENEKLNEEDQKQIIKQIRIQQQREHMNLKYQNQELFSVHNHLYSFDFPFQENKNEKFNNLIMLRQNLRTPKNHKRIFILNDAQITPFVFNVTSYTVPIEITFKSDVDDITNRNKLVKLRNQLLSHCKEALRSAGDFKFLFLIDERPIQQLYEIPEDCNLILVSRNPICNFWRYICSVHKVQFRELDEIGFCLNRLNKLKSESEISRFLREKENFIFDSKAENEFLLGLDFDEEQQQRLGKREKSQQIEDSLLENFKKNQFSQKSECGGGDLYLDFVEKFEKNEKKVKGVDLPLMVRYFNKDLDDRLSTKSQNCFKMPALEILDQPQTSKQRKLKRKQFLQQKKQLQIFRIPQEKIQQQQVKQGGGSQVFREQQEEDEREKKQFSKNLSFIEISKVNAQELEPLLEEEIREAQKDLDYVKTKAQRDRKIFRQNNEHLFLGENGLSFQDLEKKSQSSVHLSLPKIDLKQKDRLGLNKKEDFKQQVELEHCVVKKNQFWYLSQNKVSKIPARIIEKKCFYQGADDHKQNHINKNLHKYDKLQRDLSRMYPFLKKENIPKILSQTSFTRNQIHAMFAKFKSLILLKSDIKSEQVKSTKKLVAEGLQVLLLKQGFDILRTAPDEQLERVVTQILSLEDSQSRNLNWEKFIIVLDKLQAKSAQGKIDLIERLLDQSLSGKIQYKNIVFQSRQVLAHMFENDGDKYKESFDVDSFSNLLAKTIYDSLNIPQEQEIPIEILKKEVEKNNAGINLLLMLCFQNLDEEIENDSEDENLNTKMQIQRKINIAMRIKKTTNNDYEHNQEPEF